MNEDEINNQNFNRQSRICKAISHPTRLRILHLLRNQELTVNEIAKKLDLKQSNISQHLRILRGTGLVENRKEGLNVYYSLYSKKISRACDLLRKVLKEIENKKSITIEE
ncbi:ArsR family transcriptional regulator [archaeon SCG-AAA382B04]|nr:ArsR family transcriptional regulator [archaeon SCG-AAA382B04]